MNRDLGQNRLLHACFRFLLTATLIHIVNATTGDGFVAFNPNRFSQIIDVADIEAEILPGVGGSISSLLMRAAMNKFKDMHFSKFGKAVPGENGTCHMAWRFRPKKEKVEDEDPNALYKDCRSFVVAKHENCSVTVLSIADYHSGGNARKRKNKDDAREAMDELLPVVETEEAFVGEDFMVSSPLQLVDVNDTLIMRKFGYMEPDNYWYRVCEEEEEETRSVIERPWHMLKKSKRLKEIASAIAGRMGSDFNAVYVKRRGEAQSFGLLQDLRDKFEQGRTLFVAANEEDLSLFDPLKEKYSVHFLDEFKDLWDSKSDWADEMRKLNNGIAVEFDGYMRDSVDTEVFILGKRQFETGQTT